MSLVDNLKTPTPWNWGTPANGITMYNETVKPLDDNIRLVASAVDNLPKPPTQHHIPRVGTFYTSSITEDYVMTSDDYSHGWFPLTLPITEGTTNREHVDHGLCLHTVTVEVAPAEGASSSSDALEKPTDLSVKVNLYNNSGDEPRNLDTHWGLMNNFFPIRLMQVCWNDWGQTGRNYYGKASWVGDCNTSTDEFPTSVTFYVCLNQRDDFPVGTRFKIVYECAFMNEARNIVS